MCETLKVHEVMIEDAAMGAQIIENYKTSIPAPIKEISPHTKGSKEFVFDAYAVPMIKNGEMSFPELESFATDVINELSMFPDGELDDYVDSVSQYAEHCKQHRTYGAKKLIVHS